ncbi:hypothetical protein [Mucilaginibacter pedocola]|nr:hypothetical protein [Mucilaginibacter pedocola]
MSQTSEELVSIVQSMIKENQFSEITTLLTDELLSEYKNAELYSFKARSYLKQQNFESGLFYAE